MLLRCIISMLLNAANIVSAHTLELGDFQQSKKGHKLWDTGGRCSGQFSVLQNFSRFWSAYWSKSLPAKTSATISKRLFITRSSPKWWSSCSTTPHIWLDLRSLIWRKLQYCLWHQSTASQCVPGCHLSRRRSRHRLIVIVWRSLEHISAPSSKMEGDR